MIKKILAINCSPRKGNNYLLLNTLPKNKVEIINLSDYRIKPCDGCGKCAKLKKCKISDDFAKLIKKINEFKKIIIATPVYRLDVPSKVRSLIERTSSLIINNKNFNGKVAGIVCIGRFGGTGKIQSVNSLLDFLLSMECMIVPPIVIGNAHKIGEIRDDLLAKSSLDCLVKKMMKI